MFKSLQSLLASFVLCCFSFTSNGQSYTNVIDDFGIAVSYMGGESSGGCSFADWNNDGFDDLTVCQNGDGPKFYKNNNGTLTLANLGIEIDGEMKQVSWVDFDNDGDRDFFASVYEGETVLYENDEGVFVDISENCGFIENEARTFGHSWGDFNRDGLLDVYLCNYEYFVPLANECYLNNGDGTFTEVASDIGIDDSFNFSFQSVWLDYNDDGWPDLFVINDRLYSENHMYRNDGGTFTDVSAELNLDEVIFSMSNTVGDYDNDGDMDIYVTNNPTGHLLHRMNEEGTYDEVADEMGVATYDMGWAAQWIDYDNDGWQDLHVNCSPFWQEFGQNKFFVNNHDGTLSYDVSMGFDNEESWSHSSALGDYNNDGMFDIFVQNNAPDNSTLWLGTPGPNHYLKVQLKGAISNRDGVGSKIECHIGDLTQTRYTYCGEGYLSQNSYSEIFGLDTNLVVDSMVVTWLSGHVDTFYNVEADQSILFHEGESLAVELEQINDNLFCNGDSLILHAPEGYTSFQWSNGDTSAYTVVYESQIVSLTAATSLGLSATSEDFEVFSSAPIEFELFAQDVGCYGAEDGMVFMNTAQDSLDFNWSMELEGDSLLNLGPGIYTCTAIDTLGCSISQSVEVNEPELLNVDLVVVDATTDGLGFAEITIEGGTEPYTINWSTDDTDLQIDDLEAGDYFVSVLDSNGCEFVQDFQILFSGIVEHAQAGFKVFPNPSLSDDVTLQSEVPIAHIRVFNMQGKLVQSRVYPSLHTIDQFMDGCNSGIYMLEIGLENQTLERVRVEILSPH